MPFRTFLAFVLLTAASPAAAQQQIGKAASITVLVTGSVGGSSRALRKGDDVHANERIVTDTRGTGQFEFVDSTRLAVGPGSSVTLDRFIYDDGRKAGEVAIALGRGAFRFISGRSPRSVYSITTTTATIGIRGTTFDLYVADSGALCIAMLTGSVRVCPSGRNCRDHGAVGQYLFVTPDQSFWLLDRWDGSLVGGVSFEVAMPFLASQQALQPPFRAPETVAARYRATR